MPRGRARCVRPRRALVDGRFRPEARVLHVAAPGYLPDPRPGGWVSALTRTIAFRPATDGERSKALAEELRA